MKNLLLVYVILLGCFSANAQEFVKKFRIEGHIKGLETPDGKMYLRGLVNANGVNQTDTRQCAADFSLPAASDRK